MTTPTLQTLADFRLRYVRCCGCIEELPATAIAEQYGEWVVIQCPKCRVTTPFRLEAK